MEPRAGSRLTEGQKDRPCAIVLAARRAEDGLIRTIVAPITHRPPDDPASSLEIPAMVCRALELDEGSHWLRLDELNRFVWPGYDLRQRANGRYDYGMLPAELFERLKRGVIELHEARRNRIVGRED
ncbi:hypothetical protein [Chelatococcus sambhunathii]|uniref:hypothetical protein n=1 Tax=Chelatococcus sambhunathii TaxID=363953 RepID=UPI002852B54F|nr:hypothetical protein [Chelatococcus sambhunathii]